MAAALTGASWVRIGTNLEVAEHGVRDEGTDRSALLWVISIAIVGSMLCVPPRAVSQNAAPADDGSATAAPSAQELALDETLIRAFAASHDAADLKKAVDAITSAPHMNALAGHRPDPDVVTHWLELFSAMDAAEEILSKKLRIVAFCGDSGGEPFPEGSCGLPPSEVKDPTQRRKYEAAIAENENARLTITIYAQIRSMRDRVDSFFWSWAGSLYHGNADAQTEIAQQAKALGCSQARTEWVEAVMGAAKGTFPPDNPAALNEFITAIPTKLKIVRTADSLSVSFDSDSKQPLLLTAGQGLLTGIQIEQRFYLLGTERPSQPNGLSLSSSIESIFTTDQESIRVLPGKSYVVEEELTIFETDVPAQHMWMPKDSPKYGVLWHGVVKQIVY